MSEQSADKIGEKDVNRMEMEAIWKETGNRMLNEQALLQIDAMRREENEKLGFTAPDHAYDEAKETL